VQIDFHCGCGMFTRCTARPTVCYGCIVCYCVITSISCQSTATIEIVKLLWTCAWFAQTAAYFFTSFAKKNYENRPTYVEIM